MRQRIICLSTLHCFTEFLLRYARMLEWVTLVNNSGATWRLRWLRLVNK